MEIIQGKYNGFCFGVKRAVEGTLNTKHNKKIYCLGELVHNKQVVDKIKENNIDIIESLDEIEDNSIVIIRAHGVPEEIYEIANKRNIELIDYTCPFVKKIHDICKEYKENNYFIFVVGIDKHPETVGNISYCGNNYSLITGLDDLDNSIKKYNDSNLKNSMIIFQTTYNTKIAKEIISYLNNNLEIKPIVKNTICSSTEQRQNEVNEISKIVEMTIIVGGKNSSNTNKLYDISKRNCDNTIKIETKDDLSEYDFNNYNKIAIISGASTPQEIVDEIIEYIKQKTQ